MIEEIYLVTRIIIPPQTVSQTTCTTTNYSWISNLVYDSGLMLLGWVHTHPQFEAFLSQIDVHTAWEHQRVIPEFFSVVWCGLTNEFKIFRTDVDPSQGYSYEECCHVSFLEEPRERFKEHCYELIDHRSGSPEWNRIQFNEK